MRMKMKMRTAFKLLITFCVLTWLLCRFLAQNKQGMRGMMEEKIDKELGHIKTQSQLDYFATKIRIKYRVLKNHADNEGKPRTDSEVILTNTGDSPLPPTGWELVFTQIRDVQPDEFPRSDIFYLTEYGVMLQHVNGQMYRFVPMETFGGILPLSSKVIQFSSFCCHLMLTDTFPNWYFSVPGLEPRVVENTRGNELNFVHTHDSPLVWKMESDQSSNRFDMHNPPSSLDLHREWAVQDLKTAPIPVIPTPLIVEQSDSTKLNILSGGWRVIVLDQLLASEATLMAKHWNLPLELTLPVDKYILFMKQAVDVIVPQGKVVTAETYDIHVDPAKMSVTVQAPDPAGAFYAVQSLLSLTSSTGEISEMKIKDGPRYRYRGFMLDVARNFQEKRAVLRYLDVMAMYKMNKLHLHLSDDEGWRLEIPGLEELTMVGGKRCHDFTETKCLLPYLGSGPTENNSGSGYYTTEDYRDIVRYATERHIEVIPEVDMPGHCHAAIKAMEARFYKYNKTDSEKASRYLLSSPSYRGSYRSVQGFNDNVVNPCLGSTFRFIEKVVDTLIELHKDIAPLKTYHLGGDEVPPRSLENMDSCSKWLKSHGHNEQIKTQFTKEIAKVTSRKGLDLAAWEDAMSPNRKIIPRNDISQRSIIAFVWNNFWEGKRFDTGYNLANNGYKIVLTPATNLYLDHPHEPHPLDPGLSWAARYTNLYRVFRFMPENLYWTAEVDSNGKTLELCTSDTAAIDCPPLLHPENVEGIQATLFGELLRTEARTDYMVLPRLLAVAERAWHATEWEFNPDEASRQQALLKDWALFANSVSYRELKRLDKMGFNYRVPPPGARITGGLLETSLELPGLPIQMSLDGGGSWTTLPHEPVKVPAQGSVLLRAMSANGESHHSRVVEVLRETL